MKPLVLGAALWCAASPLAAQSEREAPVAFSFAAVGSPSVDGDLETRTLLRAVGQSPARFAVHFDLSPASTRSCADGALTRRFDVLDASAKPVVPVVVGSAWASCADVDPVERLARVGDTLFGTDEALGQGRLRLSRQSALPRFARYRENLRWQVGNVLFVALNLPDNNNNFRLDAGRNGEFEDRVVANRAWLERAFRLATERRLAGIAIFVDASPRFGLALRAPDPRVRERDGYLEFKQMLATLASAYAGPVLVVQGRATGADGREGEVDRPLKDGAGKPVARVLRTALPADVGSRRWLRIEVDPRQAGVFRVVEERVFDDPSGELYGPR